MLDLLSKLQMKTTCVETTTRDIVPLAAELSQQAKVGHIFDHLKSGSLISICKFCKNKCIALFTKHDVKFLKHGKVIFTGHRNAKNGLWNIPLAPKDNSSSTFHQEPTNSPQHQANISRQNKTQPVTSTAATLAHYHQLSSEQSNVAIINPGLASPQRTSPNTFPRP
jgi:hypothetical protein